MSNVLAIIPARSGSKRIPGKNIKNLCGSPLISWTISTAKKSAAFKKIVVSTEDDNIANQALKDGASVPFLRDIEYATDEADVILAVLEMLDHLSKEGEDYDYVMLLQPTSPFRSVKSILESIKIAEENGGSSVVSVSPATIKPNWLKTVTDGYLEECCKMLGENDDGPQDLYQLNGVIYLSTVESLYRNRSFYSDKTSPYIIDDLEESIDIDTHIDWSLAETIAEKRIST